MFSIVIPLYNKAHTIQKTLKSVFSQTYKNFEVIIVDDGSTDSGVSVIKGFLTDGRIRIINQKNQGVSVARNNGIAAAKYEKIAFLDGDDEWLPQYLEKMTLACEMFPNAGMYCCAGFVKDDNSEYLRLAKKHENKITKIDYFENPHVFTHISATIINKAVFYKTQGFIIGMKKNEDFALLFSIAINEDVVYCGYPLSVYWGGVFGQATSMQKKCGYTHADVAHRFKACYSVWLNSSKNNKTFLIFERYEIRHIVLQFIRDSEYEYLKLFLIDLGQLVMRDFSKLEKALWLNKKLKLLAICEIYLTKIIWRLHGFPVVGRT